MKQCFIKYKNYFLLILIIGIFSISILYNIKNTDNNNTFFYCINSLGLIASIVQIGMIFKSDTRNKELIDYYEKKEKEKELENKIENIESIITKY